MPRHTLRHHLGALFYDWPRFIWRVMIRQGWPLFHNRSEVITVDPPTGGVRCEWQFTSDLHLCRLVPATGAFLLRSGLVDWPIGFADHCGTTGTPVVSFVIGHRGEARLPHLLLTLRSIAAQEGVPVECIVVEQSEQPLAAAHLPPWVRHIHTPIESDSLPYNRSWTLNVGARAARGRLLVLHDNDFLVPRSYAAELERRHAEGWEFIDGKRFMFYLSERSGHEVLSEGRLGHRLELESVTQNLLGGGSIAADRDAYFEIGGFDEGFVGWGGEDNDFWDRAQTRRTYAFARMPLVHLWHAPQPEKQRGGGQGVERFRHQVERPVVERISELKARTFGRLEGTTPCASDQSPGSAVRGDLEVHEPEGEEGGELQFNP